MRRGTLTRAEARALEGAAGAGLDFLDVTVFGDREPMFLLLTPRCAYCGRPRPEARCLSCGAGVIEGRS